MPKKFLADIRPPQKKFAAEREPEPKEFFKFEPIKTVEAKTGKRKIGHLKIISATLAIAALAFISISVIGFFNLKNTVAESAPSLYEKFEAGKSALKNFETEKAKELFQEANQEIRSIKSETEKYGLAKISEIWSALLPKLKAIPETFSNLTTLGESSFIVAGNMEELKNEAFKWLLNQGGASLIRNFESTKENISKISEAVSSVKNRLNELDYPFGGDSLAETITLLKMERVLGSLVNWIKNEKEKHILIMFQNPSELRPGGGFLGSYADLALNQNGIQNIKVWDIYDPDGQLKINIIPPFELQGITPRWGARDANWFFDFPQSAKKIISLLEKSKIYEEKEVTFDALIAINVNVVETILKAVGEVNLPDYKLTVTPENFLSEIQKEVESGADNLAGEPKRILKVLTPIILGKIGNFSESQKKLIFEKFKHHIDKKDIMFFSKDWDIQNYLEEENLAGRVYQTAEKLNGDYLAVVSSNIAGGKSDAVTTQKIKLSSKIGDDGKIDNYLVLEKTHGGEKRNEPWYQKANRSHIKIFTPNGSKLIYLNGNEPRKISPAVNYEKSSYLKDQDLNSIEITREFLKDWNADKLEEAEKTVFSSWFSVPAGETKKLELQYAGPDKINLFDDQIPYQFVFEKQSGARVTLDLLIEAPTGYTWQENGTRFFNFLKDDPDGREIINLTLVRDPTANQQ